MNPIIPRSPHDWLDTKTLRQLIKSNLGYGANQVSCSKGHSTQYLTVTVRDPNVDIHKLKQFVKSLDSWTIDNTDYCSGQSINLCTSPVDDIHAAPYVEEIKRIAPLVPEGKGEGLSTGAVLWKDNQGFYVGRGQERMHYVSAWDVLAGTAWAVNALACQMARMVPHE